MASSSKPTGKRQKQSHSVEWSIAGDLTDEKESILFQGDVAEFMKNCRTAPFVPDQGPFSLHCSGDRAVTIHSNDPPESIRAKLQLSTPRTVTLKVSSLAEGSQSPTRSVLPVTNKVTLRWESPQPKERDFHIGEENEFRFTVSTRKSSFNVTFPVGEPGVKFSPNTIQIESGAESTHAVKITIVKRPEDEDSHLFRPSIKDLGPTDEIETKLSAQKIQGAKMLDPRPGPMHPGGAGPAEIEMRLNFKSPQDDGHQLGTMTIKQLGRRERDQDIPDGVLAAVQTLCSNDIDVANVTVTKLVLPFLHAYPSRSDKGTVFPNHSDTTPHLVLDAAQRDCVASKWAAQAYAERAGCITIGVVNVGDGYSMYMVPVEPTPAVFMVWCYFHETDVINMAIRLLTENVGPVVVLDLDATLVIQTKIEHKKNSVNGYFYTGSDGLYTLCMREGWQGPGGLRSFLCRYEVRIIKIEFMKKDRKYFHYSVTTDTDGHGCHHKDDVIVKVDGGSDTFAAQVVHFHSKVKMEVATRVEIPVGRVDSHTSSLVRPGKKTYVCTKAGPQNKEGVWKRLINGIPRQAKLECDEGNRQSVARGDDKKLKGLLECRVETVFAVIVDDLSGNKQARPNFNRLTGDTWPSATDQRITYEIPAMTRSADRHGHANQEIRNENKENELERLTTILRKAHADFRASLSHVADDIRGADVTMESNGMSHFMNKLTKAKAARSRSASPEPEPERPVHLQQSVRRPPQGAANDWRVIVLDTNFLIDDFLNGTPFKVIKYLLRYKTRITFTLSGAQMAELTGLAPAKSRVWTARHQAAQSVLNFIQNRDECPKDQMQIMDSVDSQAFGVDRNTTNQGRDIAMRAWARIIKDHLGCDVWIFTSDKDTTVTAERVDGVPCYFHKSALNHTKKFAAPDQW